MQPTEEKTLRVKKEELRKKDSTVLFEPERNVKQASYLTYIFEEKEFQEKLGPIEKLASEFDLNVEILETIGDIQFDPTNRSQQPIGGFQNYSYRCRILGIL